MFRQLLAQWLAFSLFLASSHPLQAQSAAGPAFTLPKTAVVLDLSVQKLTNTPGAFCEFADLFVPGLDLDVSCNGSLIRPLACVLDDDGNILSFKPEFKVPTLVSGKPDAKELLSLIETASKAAGEAYTVAKTDYEEAKNAKDNFEKLQKSLETAVANETVKASLKKTAQAQFDLADKAISQVTKENPLYNKDIAKKLPKIYGLEELNRAKEMAAAALEKAKQQAEIAQKETETAKNALKDQKQTKEQIVVTYEKQSESYEKAKNLLAKMKGLEPFVTYRTRIQSYSVSTVGLPDPDYLDAIPSRSGFLVDATQKLTIGENGVIQGIDLSKVDRTAEVILSVVKAAAGIFGRIASGRGLGDTQRAPDGQERSKTSNTDSTPLLAQFEKEFIADSKVKDEFKVKLLENFRVLPQCRQVDYALAYYASESVKAKLTSARASFSELRSLWSDYNSVITSNSGAGASAVLAAQEKRIADLTQADWIGETSSLNWNPKYQFVPAKNLNGTHTPENMLPAQATGLFSFGSCGLRDTDPVLPPINSNAPRGIFCKTKDLNDKDVAKSVKELAVSFLPKADTLAEKAKRSLDKFPKWDSGKTGIPFIIPEEISVNLTNSGLNLTPPSALIAQWGHATRLPEELAARDGGLTITYYSATGAIQNITMISKSKLESKTIDSIASSVDTALKAKLDADKAANTAANAASDKLALLEREKKILEAQVAIKKACEQLPSGCPVI